MMPEPSDMIEESVPGGMGNGDVWLRGNTKGFSLIIISGNGHFELTEQKPDDLINLGKWLQEVMKDALDRESRATQDPPFS